MDQKFELTQIRSQFPANLLKNVGKRKYRHLLKHSYTKKIRTLIYSYAPVISFIIITRTHILGYAYVPEISKFHIVYLLRPKIQTKHKTFLNVLYITNTFSNHVTLN
jgi:hypothetical protein